MVIEYSHTHKVFYTHSTYGERHLPKAAGFFWNGRLWITSEVARIEAVLNYCTPAAAAAFHAARALRDAGIAASMAVDYDIEIPIAEGMSYRGYQKAGVAYVRDRPAALIGDEMGLGKAQPLSEPILTPQGWKTVGDIKVGGYVIGSAGKPVKVLGVYPQKDREVWAVTFSDGTVVRCSPDHLWTVRDKVLKKKQEWRTVSLREICSTPLIYKSSHKSLEGRWEIPVFPGVELGHRMVDIDPWLLGQLLGSGHLSGKAKTLSLISLIADPDVTRRIEATVPGRTDRRKQYGWSHGLTIKRNPFLYKTLADFGLTTRTVSRYIPPVFLQMDKEDRIELLRGLMDSNGSSGRTNVRTTFHTSSFALAWDVATLVRSLGGTASVNVHPAGARSETSYRVNMKTPFNPFFSARKRATWRAPVRDTGNKIVSVERVADEDCQCIYVDSPDHLYVTTGYKLTHNTLQAIGVLNLDPSLRKVLIACPLAVKTNWGRELRRFLAAPRSIEEVETSRAYLTASIVIVHFNQLSRLRARLRQVPWDVVIVDEAHTLRNQTAMTQALFGVKGDGAIRGRQKTIHLSGTPAVNYPIELFPLINHLDPVTYPWSAFKQFKQDFGDPAAQGYRDRVIAFQERLRKTLMIRRLKKDVLTELPPKIRQVVELPAQLSAELLEINAKAIKVFEASKEFLVLARAKHNGAIEGSTFDIPDETVRYDITELSRVRHMNAVAKIPYAIAYIEEALQGAGKVVVFAHHQDVLRALHAHFGSRSVLYVGGLSAKAKDAATQAFQTKDSVRLFFGSIYAAGTGITLTAGSHCIFVELDWVPGTMDQTEDRLHRIGQRDSVLVQHLVFPGSLDMRMAEVLLLKQEGLQALTNYELLEEGQETDLLRQAADTSAIEAAAAKIAAQPKKVVKPMAAHHTPEVLAALGEAVEELFAEGMLGNDTSFVRSILACRGKWSPAQALCVDKLIRKYRGRFSREQLQRAGVGDGQ